VVVIRQHRREQGSRQTLAIGDYCVLNGFAADLAASFSFDPLQKLVDIVAALRY
jgi:hypothetical protein